MRPGGWLPLWQRYVWREAGATFLAATLLLAGLLTVGGGAQLARQIEGAGATVLGAALPVLAAASLAFALPLGLLLATTFTFSRLAADGEVDGFRSAGIPARRLLPPVLLLGAATTAALLWVHAEVAPMAHRQQSELARRAVRQVLADPRGGERTVRAGSGVRIHWRDRRGGELTEVTVVAGATEGLEAKLVARRGRIRLEEGTDTLVLDLERPELTGIHPEHGWSEKGRLGAERKFVGESYRRLEIPLLDPAGKLPRLLYLTNDQILGANDALREMRDDLNQGRVRPWRNEALDTEVAKRAAVPLAGLLFPLVGAPLGCAIRRRSRLVAFAAGFLPILLVYYPLLQLGEALGAAGTLPAAAALALPHAALGILGVGLVRVYLWN
ncbi:MAG: LptF/LptG family permease [Planctomycetales bacterium]|nr:LptF/LptG family permease [Planctomycetales bacterium]